MITYLIIDDEHIAHDIIKGYGDLVPNMRLMKNCYDALEAFDYLTNKEVDLIFLDLNMPVLKGFDFIKTLNNPPKIIITTAHKEHALEGYEYNIADYLLKPFSFERFLKAVNKAFSNSSGLAGMEAIEQPTLNQIFIKSNKKSIQLDTSTILYLEAAGNYTKIITSSETFTIRDKISAIHELLPKSGFLHIHKSFVVATTHIRSIEGNSLKIGEVILPVGKLYKANIIQLTKRMV